MGVYIKELKGTTYEEEELKKIEKRIRKLESRVKRLEENNKLKRELKRRR